MRNTLEDNLDPVNQTGLLDSLAQSIHSEPSAPSAETPAIPALLPVLPLRNSVLFPNVIMPVNVGRRRSVALLESLGENKLIAFVAQKDADIDDPAADDLFTTGTAGMILKVLQMPDGSRSIIVQGLHRIELESFTQTEPFYTARIRTLEDAYTPSPKFDAYTRSVKQLAAKVIELSPNLPNEAAYAVQNIENPLFLIHFIASNLSVSASEKQAILELSELTSRAEKLTTYLNREIQILELSKQIQTKVKTDIDKVQREFFLRQQLKTIQSELGELDSAMQDLQTLRVVLAAKKLPDEIRTSTEKEIDKLSRIPQASPDYSMTRTYIDWLLSLPWSERTGGKIMLRGAEKILNEDHYGLEKVKTRILEYLAVLKLKSNMKAPILCFFGPPGVGKTSLGKSIARALGRKFIRISLGGVRDEAEIRGHRRTYIGALPGRIIQGLKKAGTSDPVFMLDEIDKLGSDFRGDPSSALLEVLDPAQNFSFSDHYLEVPFDLSKVMFIATANSLETIPLPLRDRMEIINITGYTEFEKQHIAQDYLVPRQTDEHGIRAGELELTAAALSKIITSYTREAGVRNLEREIAGVCRGVAKDIAMAEDDEEPENTAAFETESPASQAPTAQEIEPQPGETQAGESQTNNAFEGTSDKDLQMAVRTVVKVDADDLKKYLGFEKFFPDVSEAAAAPGVAIGLAWTPVGGDILFIESTVMKGSGRLILTGQLGEVMKESAQAALSYLKSCADYFAIPDEAFKYWDVHVHIPQGAIPKDGPSAGVTLLTSLASIFTQRKVRPLLAMTGEITLRGNVLPVGGIKEKILAAKRAGITEILLPERNRNDVHEIGAEAVSGLTFKYFSEMDDMLDDALEPAEPETAKRYQLTDAPCEDDRTQLPQESEQVKSKIVAKGDEMTEQM
ncbi:MAG: endopeptidase La [Rhizobacter sp.]|nr:endopeptidase La [Chlorobiales bacterium]